MRDWQHRGNVMQLQFNAAVFVAHTADAAWPVQPHIWAQQLNSMYLYAPL